MASTELLTIFFALIGGGVPPLIWLWFWLKEDSIHPEPKPLIIATFVGGMIAVPIALLVEKKIVSLWFNDVFTTTGTHLLLALFFIVSVEEIVKYLAAQGIAFPDKHFDEPVDAIVYLISAALGFASIENTLFLVENLSNTALFSINDIVHGITINQVLVSNNLRFIGANVLHVVSSGFLGVMIGFAFYKKTITKITYFLVGLLLAILLHAVFNFSIITYSDKPLTVFAGLWILAILLIFLFERVRRVSP